MTNDHNHLACDPSERVRPEWRCPGCGEDDIDWLVWIDDKQVRCGRCGTIYHPNDPEVESLGD